MVIAGGAAGQEDFDVVVAEVTLHEHFDSCGAHAFARCGGQSTDRAEPPVGLQRREYKLGLSVVFGVAMG